MNQRYLGFFVAAAAVVMLNVWLSRYMAPAPKPKAEPAVVAGADDKAKPPADDKAPEVAAAPQDKNPAANEAAEVAPRETIEVEHLTLGSMDVDSDYRMLVTFTNRGGAVERIELNSPRYHDTNWDDRESREDESGYLGHLAAVDNNEGRGAVVQVVGAGTPAANAGLKKGDVITSFDGTRVRKANDLETLMRPTRPGQAISLDIEGSDKPIEVKLGRRPVQVVHPESNDPLSFLTTLQSIGKKSIELDKEELQGLGMRTATWDVVQDAGPDDVAFRWTLKDFGLEVVKRYRLVKLSDEVAKNGDGRAYHLTLTFSIHNTGDTDTDVAYRLDGPTGLPTEGSWYAAKIATSSKGLRDVVIGQWNGSRVTTAFDAAADVADKSGTIHHDSAPLVFAGVDAVYFASAILPQKKSPEEQWFVDCLPIRVGDIPDEAARKNQTDVTFRLISKASTIKAGDTFTQEFVLFAGPKRPELLSQYDITGLISYGWFWWVAQPMLAILHFFYSIIPNYGIAIILLTVLVRSCMFPISRKQALNAQKMQELQPEIKRLAEKYKGNMEARTKAQQELFRKHNYSPFSGCLPMFMQLPIFIGLYNSLKVDVELRLAPLISESVRWCSNLGAPDMLWYWEPFLPAYFAAPTGWLGPYLNVLPLVTIGLFIWQQKMFMPPPADEQAAMQARMMQYMMVFMGVMFFKVASGLCIYFISSSLWGIAERKLLPRTTGAGKGPITVTAVASASGNGRGGGKKKQPRGGKPSNS